MPPNLSQFGVIRSNWIKLYYQMICRDANCLPNAGARKLVVFNLNGKVIYKKEVSNIIMMSISISHMFRRDATMWNFGHIRLRIGCFVERRWWWLNCKFLLRILT